MRPALLMFCACAALSWADVPEILKNREVWNKAETADQDAAIAAVATMLGEEYQYVTTEIYTCNETSHRIGSFKHVKSGLILHLIPGGKYLMGSDLAGDLDEKPVHEVSIPAMLVGQTEATQAAWEALKLPNPSRFRGAELPVEKVNWNDAKNFCKKAGGGLRLLSEAEWEYACRAGSTDHYYWGDAVDDSHAWYRNNAEGRTHKVTEHLKDGKHNAFGLVDMLGNVYEWCEDDNTANYNDGPHDHQPMLNPSRGRKTIRGGCWQYPAANTLGSADRNQYSTAGTWDAMGFRVARGLESAP